MADWPGFALTTPTWPASSIRGYNSPRRRHKKGEGFPLLFQNIRQGGACRKTPVRRQNRRPMPSTTSVFALPDRLSAKQNPALIAADEQHFARIERSLAESIADVSERLDAARLAPAGEFGAAVERDVEVRTLSARLRTLGRYGLDLCLGRMLPVEGSGTEHPEPVYIGRLGLTDSDGARLLVDWRSPAAEPFFGATHANPMGLASRRRYRWTSGRITDYWDEVFDPDLLDGDAGIETAALDDQSAFIASLGASRSSRMRDVLGTIQADQDAIIRASSRGPLVVDGGPGTGKTVVALHRSAYLLYADQRISNHGSGLLFVGPSPAYMAYVADVLPSLGEDGAQLGTIRGLVEEGPAASIESDPTAGARSSRRARSNAGDRERRAGARDAAGRGTRGRDAVAGGLAGCRGLGRGVRCRRTRGIPQRGAGAGLGGTARDRHRPARRGRGAGGCRAHRPRPRRRAARHLRPRVAAARPGRTRRAPLVVAVVPAHVRSVAHDRRGVRAAALRRPRVDRLRPAAARRRPPPRRRPRRGAQRPPSLRRDGAAARADRPRGRRPAERGRRRGHGADVPRRRQGRAARHAARAGRDARGIPRRARRPVRAHRRRRGAGAHRRRVGHAARALPIAQLHDRRRPRAGAARVRGIVAGAARPGRAGRGATWHPSPSTTARQKR